MNGNVTRVGRRREMFSIHGHEDNAFRVQSTYSSHTEPGPTIVGHTSS